MNEKSNYLIKNERFDTNAPEAAGLSTQTTNKRELTIIKQILAWSVGQTGGFKLQTPARCYYLF